jgi:hypothetical protein
LGYWRRADERERREVQELQEHPTGKAREDFRSNWRSADLAVAEKLQNVRGTLFGEERNSELRSTMGKRAWRFETLTRDVILREVQRRELERTVRSPVK